MCPEEDSCPKKQNILLKNDELWDGWWRHLNLDLGGAQSLVQSDDSIIIFDFKHSYYDQRFCIKEKLLSLILIIKYLLFYKNKNTIYNFNFEKRNWKWSLFDTLLWFLEFRSFGVIFTKSLFSEVILKVNILK